MNEEMPTDVELLGKETLFQGRFRIDRYRLRHRLFDGGWSAEISREVFERGHAAAVLLYDPDRDAVVLIDQFRVGAFAAGQPAWLTEIVAGIVEEGESAEDVVRREAVEEAGCHVGDLLPITSFLPSPGGCSEMVSLFCGRVDSRGAGGTHGLAEEHEDIQVRVMSVDDALAALDRGDLFRNSLTLVALLWLARHRESLRRRWAGTA